MTSSESLSLALLFVSCACTRRRAPLSSFALFLAFIANVAYLNDIVASESVRWISTLTGLVGASEFGMGVERMKRFRAVSIPETIRRIDARTWIGLSLLASMGVDGFGMIVWRMFDVWIVPEATIGILVSIALLGLFGRETEL